MTPTTDHYHCLKMPLVACVNLMTILVFWWCLITQYTWNPFLIDRSFLCSSIWIQNRQEISRMQKVFHCIDGLHGKGSVLFARMFFWLMGDLFYSWFAAKSLLIQISFQKKQNKEKQARNLCFLQSLTHFGIYIIWDFIYSVLMSVVTS